MKTKVKLHELTKEDIKKAQKGDQFGNRMLYEMCERFPLHQDADVVSGKVWLIGRSYAVAIERAKSKELINDDFYEKSVPKIFLEHYRQFDEDLIKLKSRRLSPETITDVLKIHKRLIEGVKKITGHENRSFCSKYLHFHARELFFIYDSRARSSLAALVRGLGLRKTYQETVKNYAKSDCDREYMEFCIRGLVLSDMLEKKFGAKLNTRQVDNLLIEIANEKYRQINLFN